MIDPTYFGIFTAAADKREVFDQIGLIWLAVGVAGLIFRTVHLFFIRDVTTGLAWAAKIITDPYHDIKMYHMAPLHLLRGELIDPMHHVRQA
jgi:hypothetical protein